MSRTLALVLAFGGGVAVGLLLAKEYAKRTIAADVASGLGSLGFSPGTAQKIGDFVAPYAVD